VAHSYSADQGIQVAYFCFMTPYSDVVGHQRFGGPYSIHLQGEVFD